MTSHACGGPCAAVSNRRALACCNCWRWRSIVGPPDVAVRPLPCTRYSIRGSLIARARNPCATSRSQKSQSSYTYCSPVPQSRYPPTCDQQDLRNKATVVIWLYSAIVGTSASQTIHWNSDPPKACRDG